MHAELALLLIALPTFYGYYAWPDSLSRAWVYYIALGVLLASFGWVFRRRCSSQYGIAACAITCIDGTQQAVCGALSFGIQPDGVDLCKRFVPDDFYRAIGSLACAGLLVILWLPKRQP